MYQNAEKQLQDEFHRAASEDVHDEVLKEVIDYLITLSKRQDLQPNIALYAQP